MFDALKEHSPPASTDGPASKSTKPKADTRQWSTANSGTASPPQAAISRTFVYTNSRGLHARPAALLVKVLSEFKSSITADCNGERANAKSILGLLCLAVGSQSKVSFTATGPDAPEAMAVIERLFERQFDEAY